MDIPKKIINEVAVEMLKKKVVMEDIAIVPNVFQIYLHHQDHSEIIGFLGKIRDQIKVRLNKEVAKYEKKTKFNFGMLKEVFQVITGIETLGKNYQLTVMDEWGITFGKTDREILYGGQVFEIIPGEICVIAGFSDKESRKNNLPSRLNTSFVSIVKSDISKSVSFALPTAIPTRNPLETNIENDPQTPKINYSANVLSVLRCKYKDEDTKEVFEITKETITIGRDPSSDFVLEKASDRISRKHLEINHRDGKFYLKSFGVYGTTLQGKQVPNSEKVIENITQELNKEVEIPDKARIALAGGEILIDFEKVVK